MCIRDRTKIQRALFQASLDDWWWPALQLFGPDSQPDDVLLRWHIKSERNEVLRARWVQKFAPLLISYGFTVPDPDLVHDPEAGTWTSGPIDWEPLRRTLAMGGPDSARRIADAAANFRQQPLYRYLAELYGCSGPCVLPVPMMNIINGGEHADNNVDVQEFMILPSGAESFTEAMRMGSEIYHHLKKVLSADGLSTAVGDEGGFAPNLGSNEDAVKIILQAVEAAGYKPGDDVQISLDVAASEFFNKETGEYELSGEGRKLDADQMIEFYAGLVERYPIFSIEDPLDENDWEGWQKMTASLGEKVCLLYTSDAADE